MYYILFRCYLIFFTCIASFFGGHPKVYVRIDVGLYSSLIFWPGCMKLSYDNPEIEFTITNIFCINSSFNLYML